MEVTLDYVPHAGQQLIHNARDRRFRTVCCGRRWGKTRFAAGEILDAAGQGAAGDYGWIAPTYLIADRGMDAVQQIGGKLVTMAGKSPVVGTFDGLHGTNRLFFLSADNPASILGFGFHGLIVDEAARIPAKVWQQTIRPTLSDHSGWAVFISTPHGRNWFFDQHAAGQHDDPTGQHKSWTFESRNNPYFPAEEWELAKASLPEDIFRQEYMAEFLEDSAGAFRGVEYCLLDFLPIPTGPIAIGVDLAKHNDWTVLVALDLSTGMAFDMARFNQISWPIQKERIRAFGNKWRAPLVIDATGIGDPIYDDLAPVYKWGIVPVKLSNATKIPLVDRLRLAVEMAQVRWPRSWQILTDEMKRYELDVSEKGTVTYSAPAGYHDDCVIALALANTQRFGGPPADRHMALTSSTRDPGLARRPGEYVERCLP